MSAEKPAADLAALLNVKLTDGQRKMLDTLASTFLAGWREGDQRVTVGIPKGRWMVHQMRMAGVDLEAEYAALPWVPTRYGLYGLLQPTPTIYNLTEPDVDWQLTLAGCLNTPKTADATLVADAARRLVVAAAQTYSWPKSPTDTGPCTATHEAIMRNCPSSIEIEHWLPHAQVVLSTLPPLSGMTYNPARPDDSVAATWNVPDAVYLFKDCKSNTDMVNLLLELNRPVPEASPKPAPLTATAVADELDHLDAAWFRRFDKGLFNPGGLDLVTAVTTALPVATAAELEKALIDLGAIISRWQPPKEDPIPRGPVTPARIANSIKSHFPGIEYEAVLARLRVFEAVIQIRNGTAHSGSRSFVLKGKQSLGVPEAASPAQSWDHVRRAVIAASAELRALIRDA